MEEIVSNSFELFGCGVLLGLGLSLGLFALSSVIGFLAGKMKG